jgi:hypothetical protein
MKARRRLVAAQQVLWIGQSRDEGFLTRVLREDTALPMSLVIRHREGGAGQHLGVAPHYHVPRRQITAILLHSTEVLVQMS